MIRRQLSIIISVPNNRNVGFDLLTRPAEALMFIWCCNTSWFFWKEPCTESTTKLVNWKRANIHSKWSSNPFFQILKGLSGWEKTLRVRRRVKKKRRRTAWFCRLHERILFPLLNLWTSLISDNESSIFAGMVFGYGSKLSIPLNWMISILNIRYSKIRWYQNKTQFLVLFGVFQKTLIIFLTLFQDKESLDDKLPSSQCYHTYLQMMDFIYFYILTFSYSTMNSRSFISNKMVKLFVGLYPGNGLAVDIWIS